MNEQKIKYFTEFKNNLLDGIEYYRKLFPQMMEESLEFRTKTLNDLEDCHQRLLAMVEEYAPAFTMLSVLAESNYRSPPLSELLDFPACLSRITTPG